jgi:hypothetical protein
VKKTTLVMAITVVGVGGLVLIERMPESLPGIGKGRLEIGVLTLTVLLVMNLVFHFSAIQAEAMLHHMRSFEQELSRSRDIRMTVLTEADKYRQMLRAAESAQHRFYVCYFRESPPGKIPPEKEAYYKRIRKISKAKPHVAFRRIVLFTPANFPWILRLIEEHRGQVNQSLAVYFSQLDSLRPLSVQLVDSSQATIANPDVKAPGQDRDIAIWAPELVPLLDNYYENVWRASRVVVQDGKVDERLVSSLVNQGVAGALDLLGDDPRNTNLRSPLS